MIRKRFDLNNLKSISNNINYDLPKEVINIINFLAHKVGAPTYKKTPNFKKKQHYNTDKITGEDWAAIRNFKKTVINKNTDGIALVIDEIRCLLNKITKDSYSKTEEIIFKKIDDSSNLFEYEEFMKIGKLIFDIGSLNKTCSNLYAKLYKNLIDKYEIFKKISVTNYESYLKIFEKINFIDADENYNLYCDYNKENENRKSISLFFVNLMNEGVFDQEKIVSLINYLIENIEKNVNIENKVEIVEELVNNLIIFIENSYETLKNDEKWQTIEQHIDTFSNAKKSTYTSLSTKTIFKYLDLLDNIE